MAKRAPKGEGSTGRRRSDVDAEITRVRELADIAGRVVPKLITAMARLAQLCDQEYWRAEGCQEEINAARNELKAGNVEKAYLILDPVEDGRRSRPRRASRHSRERIS